MAENPEGIKDGIDGLVIETLPPPAPDPEDDPDPEEDDAEG